ncbi:hypothetical protein Cgig2_013923 [Carnegiea gigantea]|uniref:Endonuclease/exonuclease/phosphatase domain-containing protein n=1 Tax=Carnegiea gigantea TaxID=171969 RepID=A0A9Q1K263_9CARY|nr:hypothetical protein Cgig2_013923 [Carnegiea gigantea]
MRPIRSFDRQSPMNRFLLSVPIVMCLGIWRRYAGKKGSSGKNGKGWTGQLNTLQRPQLLKQTRRFIHTRVTQLLSHKNFCATFVYGFNYEQQRKPLWEDLETISHQMQEAWCVLGDFNTILRKEDRMGGDEVEDYELQELQSYLDSCKLTETPYSGAYYTWSHKTVWSRIGRALMNGYWHDLFDYTHANFIANELSDHSPIIIQFLQTSKPRHAFQYCDMWSHHSTYQGLISQALAQEKARQKLVELQESLSATPRDPLLPQHEHKLRLHYLDIISSSLSVMRQQSKMD